MMMLIEMHPIFVCLVYECVKSTDGHQFNICMISMQLFAFF